MKTKEFSCIILAAGSSSRMGEPKPLLKFNQDSTFLERIISTYKSAGIDEIVTVVNTEVADLIQESGIHFFKDHRFILNQYPERGRLYSIKVGLSEKGERSLAFLQNIDNPLVDNETLKLLMKNFKVADYAVPVFQKKSGHPLLINDKLINELKKDRLDDQNLRDVLAKYKRCEVGVNDPGILVNINTRKDYMRYFGDTTSL